VKSFSRTLLANYENFTPEKYNFLPEYSKVGPTHGLYRCIQW